MGTLDALLPPPAIHHLPVLGGLAVLLLLFFLPYAGMLLVSTAASLLARRSSPWMGEALARLTGRTWVSPAVFGVLPFLALASQRRTASLYPRRRFKVFGGMSPRYLISPSRSTTRRPGRNM